MIDVYVNGMSIDVGRQGENLARNIYFDLSDLIDTYGEGTATLVHMRPSDKAPYVCTVTRSDTFLIWAPTSTDTAYAGSGKCELRWVVGDTLAKSVIYATKIAQSITADETMPDQYQSWYEQLLAQIQAYTIATQRIDVLNARVDSFVALEDGSTTGDAELIDARIGYDGTVHTSLGTAVREQVSELHDLIESGSGLGNVVITSSADMTDTSKIYIYEGEEEGYTAGHFYYYNGSVWADGGQYYVGLDGENGTDGVNGTDGTDGIDGFSPVASVTQTETGARISITDKNGTTTADVTNGTATDAQAETYINAWLTDHPEATTTVADGSITQEKLAFPAVEGVLSPNLIDTSTLTSARFTNVNGAIQAFTSGSYYNYWRMTDFIDVHNHVGEYISVTNHNGYCFYTSEKTAIAGSGESLGMNYPANSSTDPIEIPSNAYYVRLVYWYRGTAILNPMANFGATLLEYSPYGEISLQDGSVFNVTLGEKISFENIENETIATKYVSNNLVSPDGIKHNYIFNNSTGEEESVASGYYQGLTDFIPVKENTTYYGLWKTKAGFYDANKAYLTYTSQNPFTTPFGCAYVRLVINDQNNAYRSQYYLVEGSSRPTDVDRHESYIPMEDLELKTRYRSITNRLHSLYDPTVRTAIGVYGDSNTAGLISGATGKYYENCWANLFCARIREAYDRDMSIFPFGQWGTWAGNYYSGTVLLASDACFVHVDFYGETLKINFGGNSSGTVSISIDGGEPETFTSDASTIYTASDLTEASHSVVITRISGTPQVSYVTVHKYVVAENRGSTGAGSAYLPTSNQDYDIYIAVLGTNDRGNGSFSMTSNRLLDFINAQMRRGAEVIPIVPTPATDGFETGASSGNMKMADVESAIIRACGYFNLEPISFYQYLLDYCVYTGKDLNSLFNDTLHLKESTHMILYKFLCGKFGLGQPINDYLPT